MLDAPKYLRLCSIPVPEIRHFDPYYWTLDRKQIYSRSCLCCVYANCLMCNIQYVYLYWYCSHAWSKGTLTMFWCVLDCKQISCLRTQNSFSSLWSLLFDACSQTDILQVLSGIYVLAWSTEICQIILNSGAWNTSLWSLVFDSWSQTDTLQVLYVLHLRQLFDVQYTIYLYLLILL